LHLCYSTVFDCIFVQPHTPCSMCGELAAWQRCNLRWHDHTCWGRYFCGSCQRPHHASRESRLNLNALPPLPPRPLCLACDRPVSCMGMPAVLCEGGCGAYFCGVSCSRRSACPHEQEDEDLMGTGCCMDVIHAG
jgi:hypothetical protein